MKLPVFAAGLLLASAAPVALHAQSAQSLATAAQFGALEGVRQASLSPDGKKIAFIAEADEGSRVYVADIEAGGDPRKVFNITRKVGRISSCSWVADTRIVCRGRFISDVDGQLFSVSRLYAVNADATKFTDLTPPQRGSERGFIANTGQIIDVDIDGEPGSVLLMRRFLPNDEIGSHIGTSREGLGVEKVDTVTLKRTMVEKPREDGATYISDGHGKVRMMGLMPRGIDGYVGGQIKYSYRLPGTSAFIPFNVYDESTERGFAPQAIDAAANVVYGVDDDNGFRSLYKVQLDKTLTKTKVLGKPGIDVDGVVTLGRQNRIVGATYASEKRVTEYFDPEIKGLATGLRRALPNQPLVDIVGASQDEKRLLIVASGDTMPGQYYLYAKDTRQLQELLPVRPQLKGVKLATQTAITYKAADGSDIPAYLTLPPGSNGKNIPAIVMPHGGPSARDEWGFDWLSQFFAARGFAVIQPNYRGSSGYGSAFFQKNGFQSWQTAIGDVNDAGRWLISQGITTPDKLAIVGWSYGGYAALQSSVLDSKLFKAVVAIAPVVDLQKLKNEAFTYINAPVIEKMVGNGPHVVQGSPAQNIDKIIAPVLMFSGDKDMNVNVSHPRMMLSRMKNAGKDVTYVEFPGLDHQIVEPAARIRMLSESDAFLRKHLGLPAD